jgi:hypothetical protein
MTYARDTDARPATHAERVPDSRTPGHKGGRDARPGVPNPRPLPGAPARTRLRKLECPECGYIVRVSRACIVRGLPSCCCGELLVPATLEDATLAFQAGHLPAGVFAEHPEQVAYAAACASIGHGRSGSPLAGTTRAKTADGRKSDTELAWERVQRDRVRDAQRRRLAALPQNQARRAAVAEMPF